MDETHKLFHKLANHLNNINLIAGLAKEELKTEDKGIEQDTRLVDALGKIENNVASMAVTLEELRNIVKPQ